MHRHRGLALGEPDDKLQRGTQYSEASKLERRRHGARDHPRSRTM